MRTVAPREGQDHDTMLPEAGAFAAALLLGALTAVLPAQPAAAQVAPCTAITDDAERLACYDRALRAASPAPAAAPSTQSPAPQAGPAATSSAAPAAEQRAERRVRDSAAPAAPAAPAAGKKTADDDDDGIVPIVIIGVRALPGRETRFTAQDGTTWIQTDSQRVVGLPEPPFEAQIKPGSMGSSFLVPKERGRAIRVRSAE